MEFNNQKVINANPR